MATYQPRPHPLDPVPRRWLVVRGGLNLSKPGLEVHVLGFDEPLPPPETSADEEHGEKHQREIVRDERVGFPFSPKEHGPATELCQGSA